MPPLVVLVRSALAALAVRSGPPDLAGAVVDVAPYAFGAAAFAPVSAQLVLSESSEWAVELVAPCKPRYMGRAGALVGALVVHADPELNLICSAEAYAREAARAGAAGWVLFSDALFAADTSPGWESRAFADNDSRDFSAIPDVDARSRALAPIVAALRAGARVHATLVPQRSAFDRLFDSAAWSVWRALLVLQALGALELGACRAYAYVRLRGFKLFEPEWYLCALYVVLNAYRLAYVLIDPWHSADVLSLALNCLLSSCDDSMAASGSALFIVHLATRVHARALEREPPADPNGIVRSMPLARMPLMLALNCLATCNLLFDFASSLAFFFVLQRTWFEARFAIVSVAMPAFLIAVVLICGGGCWHCVCAACVSVTRMADVRRRIPLVAGETIRRAYLWVWCLNEDGKKR